MCSHVSVLKIFFVIILFCRLIYVTSCANILALLPNNFKSHYIIFDSVLVELANRGHNVTAVSVFPKSKPVANFTDVDVSSCDDTPLDDIFNMDVAYKSYYSLTQFWIMMSLIPLLESILNCPKMREVVESKQSYDLIITEIFHTDIMLGVAYRFNAPIVSFTALPLLPWAAERIGNPDNPSYIRYPFSDTPLDRTSPTFEQRLRNTIYYVFAKVLYSFNNYFHTETMASKYIGDIPPISEIASKNTSLILSFSHFSVNAPQPLLPNVIEISGLQIKTATTPLPKDIEKFINESQHGVIYFCMGSLLRSESMPEAKRRAFQNAFAKLPQRVLWKWGDELPGKSDNVLIRKWMPQRDILAHPKVKLFISHGGALGLNEAVFESVPVLGIPMYADQTTNLNVLKSYGAAEILHYPDINEDTVLPKILQVLQKQYKENMEKVSAIYKDRPMSPMDTAIYWIEYVIRHKGASHLRSAAVDLPIYQYLLLDVIACIVLVVLSSILFLTYLLKLCFTVFCKTSEKNKKNKII